MRAILLTLLLLLSSAARAEDLVRIGWLRGTNDITLGKARGTLEAALAKQGARVEWDGPFPAAAPAVEAMNAGAIDITVGSSTSSVASLAAKAPIVIFAYQRMSPDGEAILVKAGSPIHSIADLAGHSVAVNRGGTGEYLLMRALEKNGVDPARVKRVYLGPRRCRPRLRQRRRRRDDGVGPVPHHRAQHLRRPRARQRHADRLRERHRPDRPPRLRAGPSRLAEGAVCRRPGRQPLVGRQSGRGRTGLGA